MVMVSLSIFVLYKCSLGLVNYLAVSWGRGRVAFEYSHSFAGDVNAAQTRRGGGLELS